MIKLLQKLLEILRNNTFVFLKLMIIYTKKGKLDLSV